MKPTRLHARRAVVAVGRVSGWTLRLGFTVLAGLATFAFYLVSAADDDRDESDERDPSPPPDAYDPQADADRMWMYAENDRLQEERDYR